jgi:hypothetical protein
MTIEDVIEEALKLSEQERAEVVAHLLHSFDEADTTDPSHEAAWTEAIDRRLQDVRNRSVELIDAADALGQARATATSPSRRSLGTSASRAPSTR